MVGREEMSIATVKAPAEVIGLAEPPTMIPLVAVVEVKPTEVTVPDPPPPPPPEGTT